VCPGTYTAEAISQGFFFYKKVGFFLQKSWERLSFGSRVYYIPLAPPKGMSNTQADKNNEKFQKILDIAIANHGEGKNVQALRQYFINNSLEKLKELDKRISEGVEKK